MVLGITYAEENGYVSIGMGKIFHPGAPSGNDDKAYSWSLPCYHSPLEAKVNQSGPVWVSYKGYEDNQLPDGQIADNAIGTLQEIKKTRSAGDNTPFFLAVGFHKLHLPFRAPSKYYDFYPPAKQIEPPKYPDVPKDFPPIARAMVEIMGYEDIKNFYPNMTRCSR